MTVFDVITDSGRRYRVGEGFWARFSHSGRVECNERIWSMKVGIVLAWPWEFPGAWEDATEPVVGKHLFLSSKDVWYASTKVVKVVEVEDWTSDLTPVD